MAADDNGKKYIEQLTWLRGIAALFVIVAHSVRATEQTYVAGEEAANNTFMSFFELGSYGVILFFALSGCTLYISNVRDGRLPSLQGFYIKRVMRIWPAFLISLAIYIGFGYLFEALYVEPLGNWIERQFLYRGSSADLISYSFLTFNVTGPWGLYNNAYWSVPVEFQYYLMFPLMVLSMRSFGLWGPAAIGVFLYFLPRFGLFEFDTYKMFYVAFSFCGGVIIGQLYVRDQRRLSMPVGLALFLLVLAFTSVGIDRITAAYAETVLISNKWNWFGLTAIASVYIVLITDFRLPSALEGVLKHYGTISYSTYLYHNLFIGVAVLLLIHMGVQGGDARLFFTFFFTLFTTWFAAGWSFRYIEKPSIDIGRKLAPRRKKA